VGYLQEVREAWRTASRDQHNWLANTHFEGIRIEGRTIKGGTPQIEFTPLLLPWVGKPKRAMTLGRVACNTTLAADPPPGIINPAKVSRPARSSLSKERKTIARSIREYGGERSGSSG
jgi:hypothetical protein